MNLTAKQKLVKRAYDLNPETANNRMLMCITVWRLEGADIGSELEKQLLKCTRPETIARRERELTHLELIKLSEEATEEREEAFKNELEMHSDNKVYQQQAISWLEEGERI